MTNKIPTASEFVSAFKQLRETLNTKLVELLNAHFNSPNHTSTASRLAEAVGYKKHTATNNQYGSLSKSLAAILGYKPKGQWIVLILETSHPKKSAHANLTLRPEVVYALEKTGIVKKISRLISNDEKTFWRMAMKFGNQGNDLWPQCKAKGVAAIAYYPLHGVDLNRYSSENLPTEWNELQNAQRGFMRMFAFEIKPGDEIFVKDGPSIVGRGKVLGKYRYVSKRTIVDPRNPDLPFAHQLPVKWEAEFKPIRISLGSEPSTILKLTDQRLEMLIKAIKPSYRLKYLTKKHRYSYEEGNTIEIVKELSLRNSQLRSDAILEKKCVCEACGFIFENFYGEIGSGFIEVHHKKMLTSDKGKSRLTTLSDVSVVCANCHRMIHRAGKEPLTIKELQEHIENQRKYLNQL